MRGLLILLAFASVAFANPDSLRLVQLEAQVAQIEAEKIRKEKEAAALRITTIEADIDRLMKSRVRIDNQAMWTAGDKVQSAIILGLFGAGCSILAQVGASSENYGVALLGFGGAITFEILSIVKMYSAGESLKRASNP